MCSAGVVFGHERVSGDGRLFRVEQVVEFGDQPDEAAEDEDRGGDTDDTHQEYVEAHRGYPAIWQRPTIQKNRNGSSFSRTGTGRRSHRVRSGPVPAASLLVPGEGDESATGYESGDSGYESAVDSDAGPRQRVPGRLSRDDRR
mgnify:CR=1 FL=1